MSKPKCASESVPPCDLVSQEAEISDSCDARSQGTRPAQERRLLSLKHDAILLLGPTGAGKSPLGDLLAERGLNGRRCVHFDFGAQLRLAAAHGGEGLTDEDVAYVQKVLTEGALLEDETFYIARAILNGFMVANGVGEHDRVVLNGLPRHAGQARDVAQVLDVRMVIALECTAEVVHERIAGNTGGDRTGRRDDSIEEIARKLEIYAARTHPLLDHYKAEGVQLRLISVGVNTSPTGIVTMLNEKED